MIGVFDSGVGGLISYGELRRLLPSEDIIYLADRKNAPYGTKSKDELICLVKKDISRLTAMGAKHILIACCTASAVYGCLSENERAVATPIILPTLDYLSKRAASKDKEYRVTVIATERTVALRAFSSGVNNNLQNIRISEIAAQELVTMVESGERDGKTGERTSIFLDSLCKEITETSPDALILGCTHFSHLKYELSKRLPGVEMLSPAIIGAGEIFKIIRNTDNIHPECGRCIYTE